MLWNFLVFITILPYMCMIYSGTMFFDFCYSIDILTAMKGLAVCPGAPRVMAGCNVPLSQYRNSQASNIKAVDISFTYRIDTKIYQEFLPYPFLE